MPQPLTDVSVSPQTTASLSMTARQRLESMLGNLPSLDGVIAQSAQSAAGGTDVISQASLVEPLQRINEVMRPYSIEFELRESTSRFVTRIVDRDNGEVIRQIPAEEMLRVAERLEELRGRLIKFEA